MFFIVAFQFVNYYDFLIFQSKKILHKNPTKQKIHSLPFSSFLNRRSPPMLSYLKHLGNDAPYRDRLGSLLVAYGGVNDISDPTFAELLESEIAHILRYPLADRLMFKTLVESMLNPPPLDSFLALGGPGRFLFNNDIIV